MKIKKLMLFTYDFPHKKTQDFLLRLIVEGYKIKYCIVAPWRKLNIQAPFIRIEQKHVGLIHPRLICQRFNIKYLSSEHNSKQVVNFIKNNPVDLYIIAGARILSQEIIQVCNDKILNIHPGLLPDVRGLDTFLWSIHYEKPLGISAHFIKSKIDSGLLIYKENLGLYKNDAILDINLRLLEQQNEVLIKALNILKKTKVNDLKNLLKLKSAYNTKMEPNLEKATIKKFKSWLKKFAI